MKKETQTLIALQRLLITVEGDNVAKACCFYILILAEIILISRFLKMPNLT